MQRRSPLNQPHPNLVLAAESGPRVKIQKYTYLTLLLHNTFIYFTAKLNSEPIN